MLVKGKMFLSFTFILVLSNCDSRMDVNNNDNINVSKVHPSTATSTVCQYPTGIITI